MLVPHMWQVIKVILVLETSHFPLSLTSPRNNLFVIDYWVQLPGMITARAVPKFPLNRISLTKRNRPKGVTKEHTMQQMIKKRKIPQKTRTATSYWRVSVVRLQSYFWGCETPVGAVIYKWKTLGSCGERSQGIRQECLNGSPRRSQKNPHERLKIWAASEEFSGNTQHLFVLSSEYKDRRRKFHQKHQNAPPKSKRVFLCLESNCWIFFGLI